MGSEAWEIGGIGAESAVQGFWNLLRRRSRACAAATDDNNATGRA